MRRSAGAWLIGPLLLMGAVQNIWLALPLFIIVGLLFILRSVFLHLPFCVFLLFFLFYRRVFLELKNQNVCFMFHVPHWHFHGHS